MEASSSSETSL